MGRRALRKIDPRLDLTGCLKTADELPEIWTSVTLFGRQTPMEIEVGSGKGLFLVAASTACPQINYLGIEVSRKYARFAAARLARTRGANAMMVHGEAVQLLHERVPDGSIGAVHVYFPDPWWKKRHQKRRIMNPQFVEDVERALSPGGVLYFWTDVEEYFRASVDLITRRTHLKGPRPVAQRPADHDLDYRTHFERRMRLNNRDIHRAEFGKPASPGAATVIQPHAGCTTRSRS